MKKLISFVILFLLVILILSPMIFDWINLELRTQELKNKFEQVRFYGILIIILLTLFTSIKSSDEIPIILLKVFGTFATVIFAFLLMMVFLFSDMCIWTDKKILFEHRIDTRRKILKRDYGCGAIDSTKPIERVFEIKEVGNFFRFIHEIKIEEIDNEKWIEIKYE